VRRTPGTSSSTRTSDEIRRLRPAVLDEAGLTGLVEFHAEESQIVLSRFLTEGRTFDLAFIDGNHRFDGIFVDLVYIGRLLRSEGSCSWTTTSYLRWHAQRLSA
jgi:hypothetical protein